VRTLAGTVLELQAEHEQKFYVEAQKKYITENKFDDASDLRAIDRLVFLETLAHRYSTWMASGKDYDGLLNISQEEQTRKNLQATATQISQIQADLGLTKSQREKDQFESVGAYIIKLQQAAKAHGVRREKQLGKALDLINQLISLAGAYRRANENERNKLDLESAEEIVDWILEYLQPEYEAVDNYFRENEQRFWVGSL
jgi:hypothetical protein